jgi:hypothetical protein
MKKKEEAGSDQGPEPFYHQSESFSSAYFGPVPDHLLVEEKNIDRKLMATVITFLTEPARQEHRHDFLATLRNNNASELLVMMLQHRDYARHRRLLLATCWETGLDFSPWAEYFAGFLGDDDPQVCLEAFTVMEQMPGPFSTAALENVKKTLDSLPANHPFQSLVEGLRQKFS